MQNASVPKHNLGTGCKPLKVTLENLTQIVNEWSFENVFTNRKYELKLLNSS